jgi:molybdenum cofactor guanylyltransferase
MADSRHPQPEEAVGVVVAGGASRRFGRDKALERLGDRRLLDRALDALAGCARRSVALGPPERLEALRRELPEGVEAFADTFPGYGPLGGVATALVRSPESWHAVLAVDLPLVPRAWWDELARHHAPGVRALVPRGPEGRWEPLAALYHGSLGAPLLAGIERGEHEERSLRSWLEALQASGDLLAVPTAELPAGALTNVNTLADAVAVSNELDDAVDTGSELSLARA